MINARSFHSRLDATQAQSEWRRYLELAEDDETEAPRLDFARERLHDLKRRNSDRSGGIRHGRNSAR